MESLLFTGGNGFLGRNTIPILSSHFNVSTLGLEGSDIVGDLTSESFVLPNRYDIVLHAAGKAHSYPKTEEEVQSFYDVNYMGTVNLCRELERVGVPKALVFISTMAVYGSDGSSCVTESHPLNGSTPYAKSKILAENFLLEWGKKHGVTVSILRPSLMTGPNPPGNLGAMIKGIRKGRYLSINHGKAQKSFLMVYDIANVIPLLINRGGIYNICDTLPVSYSDLTKSISSQMRKKAPLSIPYWCAKLMAVIGDIMGEKAPINSLKLKKLTRSSIYDNSKIRKELNWSPMNVLENFKIE